jgi:vancomycin resistance protein VanJ
VKRALRSLAATTSVLYALTLFALIIAFRCVGERWWVTGTALYLPRLVLALPLPVIVALLAVTRPPRLFWIPAAVSSALFPVLAGFVAPRPPSPAGDAPAIRILSYNVNAGGTGVADIIDEIERHAPDTVLLQEVADPEPLASSLRAWYPTVESVNQFLLATKYRVLSHSEPDKIDYAGRARSARFVRYVLETPIGRIAVYNVHPVSPREALNDIRGHGLKHEIFSGHAFSSDHAAVFQVNSGLRALQVQTIAQAAARETDPVIIAGDTNLPGLSLVLSRFLGAYQDGFAQAGWGFGYTFPTNRRPWMRIDRILASDQLRFVRFEVGTSRASDHLCVVAELQRR